MFLGWGLASQSKVLLDRHTRLASNGCAAKVCLGLWPNKVYAKCDMVGHRPTNRHQKALVRQSLGHTILSGMCGGLAWVQHAISRCTHILYVSWVVSGLLKTVMMPFRPDGPAKIVQQRLFGVGPGKIQGKSPKKLKRLYNKGCLG